MSRLLAIIGLNVVKDDNGGVSIAVVEIQLTGKALSGSYSYVGIGDGTSYYTGAEVKGALRLEVDKRIHKRTFQGIEPTPYSVSGSGPESPSYAPFKKAFRKATLWRELGSLVKEWLADQLPVTDLRGLTSDLDSEVAAQFLGALGPVVLDALISELKNGVHPAVEVAFAQIGDASVQPLIQAMRSAPNSKVRAYSAYILKSHDGEQVTAALGNAVKDEDPFVQEMALRSLRGRGTK